MPDGRAELVVSRVDDFRSRTGYALSEFRIISGFLAEALDALGHEGEEYPGHNRAAFPARVGLTFEEAQSIRDELFLIRYNVLGEPRLVSPSARRLQELTKPRRTGTPWDFLPKIEAETLPGGELALTLGRGELAVFANSVDVAMEERWSKRSRAGRSDFMVRTSMEPEEAEAFRDELRRLDRETRAEGG